MNKMLLGASKGFKV